VKKLFFFKNNCTDTFVLEDAFVKSKNGIKPLDPVFIEKNPKMDILNKTKDLEVQCRLYIFE
jgi:predicted sulfurtransferase